MKAFGAALEATTTELSRILPDSGFSSEPKKISNGGFRRQWLRTENWKADVVEIVYRRGGESSLKINLIVWFPGINDLAGHPIPFDGTGLLTPRIPGVFGVLRAKGYARQVASIVKSKLSWFELFLNPVFASDELRTKKEMAREANLSNKWLLS